MTLFEKVKLSGEIGQLQLQVRVTLRSLDLRMPEDVLHLVKRAS